MSADPRLRDADDTDAHYPGGGRPVGPCIHYVPHDMPWPPSLTPDATRGSEGYGYHTTGPCPERKK